MILRKTGYEGALLFLLKAITDDDRYENKGKAEGENRMALLIQKLLMADREEDLLKASENVEYRNLLFQEFGIA